MLTKTAYNRVTLVTIFFVTAVLFLTRCVQKEAGKKDEAKQKVARQFAGSASCKTCHQKIYEDHLHTFHHLTSSAADEASIKGSFEAGKNSFYFNPHLYIAAEKTDSGLYQTAFQNGIAKVSRKFDYVVGSGKRGQTFLYWRGNYLFQLPLTYFTATNEWTNSPGYSNKVQFNRPITARCLECHSTNFNEITGAASKADEFSKNGIVLGVECEKCHGPGAEHVAFQTQHPTDTTAHAIINPAKFSRLQKLDMCRVCHGGRLSKTQPSFSFTAGDKLSDYFKTDSAHTKIEDIDVHGNQFGMMTASKCFLKSDMTCNTCHDPHKNESKELLSFTPKCLSCHTAASNNLCKLTGRVNDHFLQQNCIDCHMPEEPSKAIMVLRQGEDIPTSAFMRSHYIAVYKEVAASKIKAQKLSQ